MPKSRRKLRRPACAWERRDCVPSRGAVSGGITYDHIRLVAARMRWEAKQRKQAGKPFEVWRSSLTLLWPLSAAKIKKPRTEIRRETEGKRVAQVPPAQKLA